MNQLFCDPNKLCLFTSVDKSTEPVSISPCFTNTNRRQLKQAFCRRIQTRGFSWQYINQIRLYSMLPPVPTLTQLPEHSILLILSYSTTHLLVPFVPCSDGLVQLPVVTLVDTLKRFWGKSLSPSFSFVLNLDKYAVGFGSVTVSRVFAVVIIVVTATAIFNHIVNWAPFTLSYSAPPSQSRRTWTHCDHIQLFLAPKWSTGKYPSGSWISVSSNHVVQCSAVPFWFLFFPFLYLFRVIHFFESGFLCGFILRD